MSPLRTTGAAGPSLAPGARLGPYTVEAALGAGGMGEVWRARDTRLGRSVALKVLPARFAQSATRLARLQREARLLASLNHPHIATLYGLEESGGTPALVMELVEGATLAARLERGALPLGEVLELGRQIAEALEAAHEKGILHRDLKPANVRLTEKGQVKLLDFGLAKAFYPLPDEPPPVHPPSTLTTAESPASPGTGVAGTAPYMSPEQARGEPLDRRSDVWAFGCVLFEMLSGRRAFAGGSVAEAVAAVLERKPDWTALPRDTPADLRKLLERCLRKDREERLRDAGDARLELEELLRRGKGRADRGVEERSAYPGLRAFDEKDAPVFFGREREVETLWQTLPKRQLLAVIGPSGAGKTSFLRAGVIPARPEGWGAVCATPGTNPALGLARALTGELAGDVEAIGELLSGVEEIRDTGALRRVVSVARRWRARHAEALVVVDQFEELFTLNPPETQARFAALLGGLVTEADLHVVLSLRDDFLMRCHEHEALAPVFSEITPLGTLTGENLRRAVVEPAGRRGYRFEDDALVDEMMGAVEGVRGALPLIAFAVARLWEKRDREGKLLTHEAYREIAGVEGALARHAEATMDRIGPEHQGLVREIFRNLVTAQGTRAVIDRGELLSAFPERAEAEAVLRQLIDARLLTTYELEDEEGPPSHHRVEVVHESLLKAWPRLVRWRAQDEEGAVLRDQLRQAAHLWEEKGRTSDLLWTGTAYTEFELWRSRYPGALTALEEGFARSMRERTLRARRLRRAAVAAVIAGLAVVATVIGISRQKAVIAAQRAEASHVLALGQLRLAEDPTEALAFAIASLEVSDSLEARAVALGALWDGPPAREIRDVDARATWARSPAFSPDGAMLAAAGHSPEALVWREDGTGPIVLSGLEPSVRGSLLPAWASPTRLVIGLCCGLARRALIWRMPGGQPQATLEFGDPSYWDVTANRLFTETPAGGSRAVPSEVWLRSWELTDGASADLGRVAWRNLAGTRAFVPPVPPWRTLVFRSSAFAPDGQSWIFAMGSTLVERPLPATRAPTDRVVGRQATRIDGFFMVRARAQSLWTRDSSKALREWTLAPERAPSVETVSGPATASNPLWPEASGRWLIDSRMEDSGVRVWRRGGWAAARPLVLRRSASWSQTGWAIHPSGNWLVSSTDAVANLTFWPLSRPFPMVVDGYTDLVRPVSFCPDGRWLLTSWADRSLHLWPLAPGGREPRAIQVPDPERRMWDAFALDPRGRFVFAVKNTGQAWIVPLDGRSARPLPGFDEGTFLEAAAVSPSGRFAASALSWGRGRPALRVWDLEGATGRAFELPGGQSDREQTRPTGYEGGVSSLSFAGETTVYTAGDGGVRRWDLATGRNTLVILSPARLEARVPDHAQWAVTRQYRTEKATECAPLVLHDLTTGAARTLHAFGECVLGFEMDPSGRVLAAGDKDGLIHVGRLTGAEPHLLVGHRGVIDKVAISPDLQWVASTGEDNTLRLWPMPDLDKTPLHVLPHDELLAKLRSLTNLRAVRDPKSATGWSVEVGAFPGWKDLPTW